MPKFWNGMSEKVPDGTEVLMVGDPSSPSTPKFALFSKIIDFLKNTFVQKDGNKVLSDVNFSQTDKNKVDSSVLYTSQPKTDAEKLQARTNINAQENLSTTTLTELNRNYTESGFLLLTDGTTVSATGYHVYSFNVNGKTKVAVDGVSIVNAVVDYCLACVYNQAGTLLQAFFIETNQTYTQQEITLPSGAYKIKVAGSSAVTARCYEVVQGYPFYTKTESDSTFVKQDGNKVLSDNNFTTALLTKLNAAITQIKTINNISLIGTGNIDIQDGSGACVVYTTQTAPPNPKEGDKWIPQDIEYTYYKGNWVALSYVFGNTGDEYILRNFSGNGAEDNTLNGNGGSDVIFKSK